MTLRVIDKNLPQPAPGVDQKLFQLQFSADGKTLLSDTYSSSVEDTNHDGTPDFVYTVEGKMGETNTITLHRAQTEEVKKYTEQTEQKEIYSNVLLSEKDPNTYENISTAIHTIL